MSHLFRSTSIRTRLGFIAFLTFIGLSILVVACLFRLHTTMLDERSAKIVGIVDGAKGIATHFHNLQVEGKLTEEQAKQQTLEMLNQIRAC